MRRIHHQTANPFNRSWHEILSISRSYQDMFSISAYQELAKEEPWRPIFELPFILLRGSEHSGPPSLSILANCGSRIVNFQQENPLHARLDQPAPVKQKIFVKGRSGRRFIWCVDHSCRRRERELNTLDFPHHQNIDVFGFAQRIHRPLGPY